jgi:predicted nucleic acid-binding protein
VARYVIDAPTLLYLADAGLRVDPGHQLVAPNSVRSEALELLLRDVRAGKREEAAALKTHERMTEIKLRLLGDRVSRGAAWRIARQNDWGTLRDAEYLALARLQADALVTVDPRLAAAAGDAVPVLPVDVLLAAGLSLRGRYGRCWLTVRRISSTRSASGPAGTSASSKPRSR